MPRSPERQRKIDEAQAKSDKIISLYHAGLGVPSIQKREGLSPLGIRWVLRSAGFTPREKDHRLDKYGRQARAESSMKLFIERMELKRRYEAGESLQQIAESIGVSHQAVRSRLKLVGCKFRNPKPVLTDEEVKAIRHHAALCVPTSVLASQFGVSESSVRLIVRGARRANVGA